ncbi:uncharacterized protein LOC128238408 [Mya arenaria]|uniref:uncharacterized protein LOC128238408 n=1 Tax=Mya arenaria TaxID=6604 RepID=UPI0022E940E4|nr:uncharacterized protein LOC128238408 [Mya arenaria]
MLTRCIHIPRIKKKRVCLCWFTWCVFLAGLVAMDIIVQRTKVIVDHISAQQPMQRFFDARRADLNRTFMSLDSGYIHILSAVAQNSSANSFYDNIVLSGWQTPTDDFHSELKCCLFYANPLKAFVANLTQIRNSTNLRHSEIEAKQYVCPNVYSNRNISPIAISLTTGERCPEDLTKYATVDFPHKAQNGSLGVCAKLVFGNISAGSLVEWFEYQRLMKVDKVIAYTYKLNEEAMKVLKYYSSTGLVEFLPFSLPHREKYHRDVGVKNLNSWNDEEVAVFDCQNRLSGYTYTGLYDFDEFIYPKNVKNLKDLLLSLGKLYPNSAGYTFKTEVYATTWGERQNNTIENDLTIGRYNQRGDPMWDRVKSIVITDRLMPGRMSTHGYWSKKPYKKSIVNESYAVLKHYRTCRMEWMNNNGTLCYKLIERHEDNTLVQVADLIRVNVMNVMDVIKATMNYSSC